jgi:hypothetical protein
VARIGCVCPPRADGSTRHPDGDEVRLRERLDFRASVTVRQAVTLLNQDDPDADTAEILAVFTEQCLLFGIESWTLVDADGKPVPVTRTAIRAFMADHLEHALTVGDEADEKYTATVLLPLVQRAQNSSPRTPTDASTSAPSGSTPTPPTPSSPSSTTTSPTDATEMTSLSLVGASS